jgi:ferrous iron transport protein A
MLTLDQLEDHQAAVVVAVRGENATQEFVRRLNELGFLPGEPVCIIARGFFGGSPLAVRVGTSTFALRLTEARCIRVTRAGAMDSEVAS